MLKGKMDEIKTDTHLALRQLLSAQKKIELRLNSNLKNFACRMTGIVIKRYESREAAV